MLGKQQTTQKKRMQNKMTCARTTHICNFNRKHQQIWWKGIRHDDFTLTWNFERCLQIVCYKSFINSIGTFQFVLRFLSLWCVFFVSQNFEDFGRIRPAISYDLNWTTQCNAMWCDDLILIAHVYHIICLRSLGVSFFSRSTTVSVQQ